jgi:hypothetical protein
MTRSGVDRIALAADKVLPPRSPNDASCGVPDAAYQCVLRDSNNDLQQRSCATHFHARYGEYEAQIAIGSGDPLAGRLPIRALRLIREWSMLHQAELQDNWRRAQAREPVASIDPLP